MADDYELVPVEHTPEFVMQDLATQEAGRRATLNTMFRNTVGAPGTVMQPVQSATPGMWSDEDEARRLATEGTAFNWAPQQALNMVGQGTPFAVEGAFGSAGGKGIRALQDVRGPRENIDTVLESNFNHAKEVGNETAPIDSLTGGTSKSVSDVKRNQALAEKIAGPDGYWERPIVDDAGNVIEGQHRIEAARALGMTDVPIYRVKDLERGLPTDRMQQAIKDTQATHPDQVHQIMSQVLDMIHESGSPQAALNQYEFPAAFKSRFEAALNAAMPQQGIRAYHGSPHDFDKFDLSKIGTGEGAQAYGHGLYFAEHEPVAEAYKKALTGLNPNQLGSGKAEFGVNGAPMPGGISGHAALDTGQEMSLLLGTMKDNPDSTMIPFLKQKIENRIANHYSMTSKGSAGDDMRAMAQYYNEHVKNAKPEDVSHIAPGRMYEVNISADPEHFLDWDKPLSEQHPKVKEAANKVYPIGSGNISAPDFYKSVGRHFSTDPEIQRVLENNPIDMGPHIMQRLKEAGIPGIKYLDQGSRGKEGGTSNYVVFDDKLIDIIKKYGLAGLIGGGAAHFGLRPVDHDPFAEHPDDGKMQQFTSGAGGLSREDIRTLRGIGDVGRHAD